MRKIEVELQLHHGKVKEERKSEQMDPEIIPLQAEGLLQVYHKEHKRELNLLNLT